MIVPDAIYIELFSDKNVDLSNIILQLKITTGRKNPRYITAPKTNTDGKSELSNEDLRGQFEDHWESGQMDYSGTLKDASPIIEVSLYDLDRLREDKDLFLDWTLLKNEKLKWKSKKEQYNYMISSTNDKFEANPLNVDIHETATIRIKVKRIE